MPAGTTFNHVSGPIRGMHRIEPLFLRPPCGIRADLIVVRAPTPASAYLQDGVPVDQLREAGFTPAELANAGVSAPDLRQAGYTTQQIANTRSFNGVQLRAAGVPLIECLGAGLSGPELIVAGYSASEWEQAGVTGSALHDLGFGEATATGISPRSTSNTHRGAALSQRRARPQTAPARPQSGLRSAAGSLARPVHS